MGQGVCVGPPQEPWLVAALPLATGNMRVKIAGVKATWARAFEWEHHRSPDW